MIYGYVRKAKKEDLGESLEFQKQELLKFNDKVDFIFGEYGSGIDEDRPILKKVLEDVTERDTVVVTEVRRLTRSLCHLNRIINLLKSKRVKLQIGNTIMDLNDKKTNMNYNILLKLSD